VAWTFAHKSKERGLISRAETVPLPMAIHTSFGRYVNDSISAG